MSRIASKIAAAAASLKSLPKAAPGVVTSKSPVKVDRRVRQTRDALGDALVELMHEKPFEAITVQHVLDRAGVSRSTFYNHYRDKNDLFLSDVEDFLEMMSTVLTRHRDGSRRVAPVKEFFAHVAEWKQFHAVLVSADKIRDFLDLSQGYFARAIEQRLNEFGVEESDRSAAQAQMFAGALLSLLSWWIGHGMPESAAKMDDDFHRMVWSGLDAFESVHGKGAKVKAYARVG